MLYQCGRCGLTRASGQEMGVIQQCRCPWEFVPPAMPQQSSAIARTWVGLTDEEIEDLLSMFFTGDEQIKAIEAKLKVKNEQLEKNT